MEKHWLDGMCLKFATKGIDFEAVFDAAEYSCKDPQLVCDLGAKNKGYMARICCEELERGLAKKAEIMKETEK